jgi:glycerophosphoryl diester phosphodiesterase
MILLYAHRGYSARFPENTRASFEAAFAHGADGIEADLQKAPDGSLIIVHDPPKERAPTAPLLDELLALLPADRLLNLEIKGDTVTRDDLPRVIEKLLSARGTHGVVISSFVHSFLPAFRRAGFETAALLGDEHAKDGMFRLLLGLLLARPRWINPPIQIFERLGDSRARAFLALLRSSGRKLAFWTVNRREDWERVRPFADALISDEVEQALGWLGRG